MAELKITIAIKKPFYESIDIDFAARLLLRDNLKTAIQDTCNGVACDYSHENELVRLEITN